MRYLVQNTPKGETLVLKEDYLCNSKVRSGASEITINKNIIIDGDGHYIDAAHCGRIFNIEASGVTLKNINFKHGLVGPGDEGILVLCKGSNINIINCSFKDCTYVHSKSDGSDFAAQLGALAILGKNTKVIDCIFDNNTGSIAHIYITGDNNEINNCKIGSIPATPTWTNMGYMEGSHWEDIYADHSIKVNGKNNIITDCTFSHSNVISSNILLNDEGNTVKNCEFQDITAPKGAIYIDSKKNTIESCSFNQINPSDIPKYENGGAIYINSNDNTINRCYFENCNGRDGGAVYINKKNNKVMNSIFVNNMAIDDGGAIYCDAVSEIKYNVFINNQAKRGKDIYS